MQFKDLMLSVDPPDEDDSDDEQRAAATTATTMYTIKTRTEDAGGDAGTTNHIGNGEEAKTNDVEMVDGEQGDSHHVSLDKESPSVSINFSGHRFNQNTGFKHELNGYITLWCSESNFFSLANKVKDYDKFSLVLFQEVLSSVGLNMHATTNCMSCLNENFSRKIS